MRFCKLHSIYMNDAQFLAVLVVIIVSNFLFSGFICPVHTPDGSPCGLLNHLTKNCIVLNELPENPQAIYAALIRLGMTPSHNIVPVPYNQCLEVVLDGGLVGYIKKNEAEDFVNKLRIMKTQGEVRKNSFCPTSLSCSI